MFVYEGVATMPLLYFEKSYARYKKAPILKMKITNVWQRYLRMATAISLDRGYCQSGEC